MKNKLFLALPVPPSSSVAGLTREGRPFHRWNPYYGWLNNFSPNERRLWRNLLLRRTRILRPDYIKSKEHKWRINNLEKIQEAERLRSRRRRAERPEFWQEYMKRYRAANRDKLNHQTNERNKIPEVRDRNKKNNKKYKTKLDERDPLIRKERKRAAYLRRRDKQIEECKTWCKRNPDKVRNYLRKRRAMKRKAMIGDQIIIVEWEKNWRAKDIVNCFWCAKQINPSGCHVDHIIALDLGGAHSLENLCISCQSCNSRKWKKTLQIWVRQLHRYYIHFSISDSFKDRRVLQCLHNAGLPHGRCELCPKSVDVRQTLIC